MAGPGGLGESTAQAPLPWTPRSPRQASPATQWRALPSSSPSHRSGADTFCPGGPLLSHLTPPAAGCSPSARSSPRAPSCCPHLCSSLAQQQHSLRPQRGAGSRKVAPARLFPCQAHKCQGKRRPGTGEPETTGSCSSGDGESAPSFPGGGPGWESFFSLLGCSATCSPCTVVTQLSETVSYVSGVPCTCPLPIRRSPGECRTAALRPYFGTPTAFPSQAPVHPLAFRPHRGYVCGFPGPACTVSGGLASAPQAVSLAHENHQTWLRDSVRPASSQVQGRSVHLCVSKHAPLLRAEVAVLLEGRDRAGPSSRDEVRVLQPVLHRTQERRGLRPILDLRVLNRALHKLPFQDVDAETHLFNASVSFDWFAAIDLKDAYFQSQSILDTDRSSLPLCVRRTSISVQGPPLRAIPVASCLH